MTFSAPTPTAAPPRPAPPTSPRRPASSAARPDYRSFTGGRFVRYPAPDVARGFMLLLIALANVPFWLGLLPMRTPSSADSYLY